MIRVLRVVTLVALAGVAMAATSANIIVYGGSGNIGQRIVNEGLNRGHTVTIVDRNSGSAVQPKARLKVLQGDVLDSAAVAKQIAGQDVVISAVRGPDNSPPNSDFYVRVAQSIVQAQRALGPGAPRLIVSGGAGSLIDANGKALVENLALPDSYKGEILGHKRSLEYLRTVSDIKWTYFSPAGTIANGQRTGVFRVGGDQLIRDARGDSRISTEDFAVAMINEIEKPQHIGKRFTVGY